LWPRVTIFLLILYIPVCVWWAVLVYQDYDNTVFIRDHGVKGFGIVTKKYCEIGRNASCYLDYQPVERQNDFGSTQPKVSTSHEVGQDTYAKYPMGALIPTKTDPRNPNNTHLDVQGYWSNDRLIISSALMFLYYCAASAVGLMLVWLFLFIPFKLIRRAPRPQWSKARETRQGDKWEQC
jgi:hypothetical protein